MTFANMDMNLLLPVKCRHEGKISQTTNVPLYIYTYSKYNIIICSNDSTLKTIIIYIYSMPSVIDHT